MRPSYIFHIFIFLGKCLLCDYFHKCLNWNIRNSSSRISKSVSGNVWIKGKGNTWILITKTKFIFIEFLLCARHSTVDFKNCFVGPWEYHRWRKWFTGNVVKWLKITQVIKGGSRIGTSNDSLVYILNNSCLPYRVPRGVFKF